MSKKIDFAVGMMHLKPSLTGTKGVKEAEFQYLIFDRVYNPNLLPTLIKYKGKFFKRHSYDGKKKECTFNEITKDVYWKDLASSEFWDHV